MNSVKNWSDEWLLKLNADKCMHTLFDTLIPVHVSTFAKVMKNNIVAGFFTHSVD